MIPIGANTRVYARSPNDTVDALTAPKHVLKRRDLQVGQAVSLVLPPQAIHVMDRRPVNLRGHEVLVSIIASASRAALGSVLRWVLGNYLNALFPFMPRFLERVDMPAGKPHDA